MSIVTSKVDDLRLAGGRAATRAALEDARGLLE
jgi:hypothetical protein